tara:strand:+ start:295 stop:759 length:465 start_codon:yes stop_codon:yes gene_type:complete
MKNNMKLIMESWRKQSLQEEDTIETVGELRKIIQNYREMEAGKEVGKKAVEMAIEMTPGISNIYAVWKGVKDGKDMLGKLYGAEDNVQSNTGMDRLNVDDNVSKIVDDRLEQAFLNDLLATIQDMGDNDPIPDVNEKLQDFLKGKFDQHSVQKS